jgi:hypothetical protein
MLVSVFKDNKPLRSHKTAEIKVFLIFLACWWKDPDGSYDSGSGTPNLKQTLWHAKNRIFAGTRHFGAPSTKCQNPCLIKGGVHSVSFILSATTRNKREKPTLLEHVLRVTVCLVWSPYWTRGVLAKITDDIYLIFLKLFCSQHCAYSSVSLLVHIHVLKLIKREEFQQIVHKIESKKILVPFPPGRSPC